MITHSNNNIPKTLGDISDFTLEQILDYMPLSVNKYGQTSKYELSLYRTDNGRWFAQYEIVDDSILYQYDDMDIRQALWKLWERITIEERNNNIEFNFF